MHTPTTPTTTSPTPTPPPTTTPPPPKFSYPFPVRLRIHSSCKSLVTTKIASISFTLVIILFVIAAIVGLVRRIGTIPIEFAVSM